MASGRINGTCTLNTDVYMFYIDWWSTPNIEGNYSDVTMQVFWDRYSGKFRDFDTVGTRNAQVQIGDSIYSWSQRFNLSPWPGKYLIKEYSARVYHSADGTRSVYLGARANGCASIYGPSDTTASSDDCVAGATVVLDTIPRASSISLSASSVTAGNNITVNISAASGSFSHSVTWSCGGYSSTYNLAAGVTSHTFAPPTSWCAAFPTANSGTLTCTVQTKSGSTNIGSPVSKTATLNVPSYSPSVSSSVSGNNLLDGEYVQNKSTVSGSVSASSSYGASITSIVTTISGKTYSGASFTSSVLSASGTVTISTVVTDSRGKTANTSKTITVQAYAPPYITSLTAQRCLENGTLDNNGTYAKVTFVGGCSSVNNKNTRIYKVNNTIITNESYTINKNDIIVSGITTDATHTITASIQDAYTTVTASVTVPTVAVTMDFHSSGNGVSFGKVAESQNLLDSAWPINSASMYKVNGVSLLNIIYPVGSIYLSVNNVNPSTLFGGTWIAWGVGRVPVGVDMFQTEFNEVEKTGGEKTHVLTTNEMPAHTHEVRTSDNSYPIGWGGVAGGGNSGIVRDSYIDKVVASWSGLGQAHNNMPPYITCYMWKRTA